MVSSTDGRRKHRQRPVKLELLHKKADSWRSHPRSLACLSFTEVCPLGEVRTTDR